MERIFPAASQSGLSKVRVSGTIQIYDSVSAPASLTFVDEKGEPKFENREVFYELAQEEVKSEEIFCKAVKAQPNTTFHWTIGLVDYIWLINTNFHRR